MNDLIALPEISHVLPMEVLAVFNNFFTAELTTLGKSGYPVTWPVLPVFWPEHQKFFIFTAHDGQVPSDDMPVQGEPPDKGFDKGLPRLHDDRRDLLVSIFIINTKEF